MAKIENVERVLKILHDREAQAKRDGHVSCVVGYKAAYALYVHEAVGMKLKGQPRRPPRKGYYWDPQGRAQAKFLEQPARTFAKDLAEIVVTVLRGGHGLAKALYTAGLRLQRESMLLCPVDTGNLKGSAFTELEQ